MDIRIDVSRDLKRVTQSIGTYADQIPFAAATALNALSKRVRVAEKVELKKQFPTATPFTEGAIQQVKARKDKLETVVLIKDITATYLAPYIDGGVHHLNSRALLNPKHINLNQYGNIPKSRLAALRGQTSVFIGAVKTKAGTVNGVWRRTPKAKRQGGAALQLLIRFGDAIPVRQHYRWNPTAAAIVARDWDKEFGKAFAYAVATARLK